jgi:hypothetical protein
MLGSQIHVLLLGAMSVSFKPTLPVVFNVWHMTTSQVQRAAGFIWLTGRALDQRRMEYFSGTADTRGVLLAMEGYSTGDGGY